MPGYVILSSHRSGPQSHHCYLPSSVHGYCPGPFISVDTVLFSQKISIKKQKRYIPETGYIYFIYIQIRGTFQHDHTPDIFPMLSCRLQGKKPSLAVGQNDHSLFHTGKVGIIGCLYHSIGSGPSGYVLFHKLIIFTIVKPAPFIWNTSLRPQTVCGPPVTGGPPGQNLVCTGALP